MQFASMLQCFTASWQKDFAAGGRVELRTCSKRFGAPYLQTQIWDNVPPGRILDHFCSESSNANVTLTCLSWKSCRYIGSPAWARNLNMGRESPSDCGRNYATIFSPTFSSFFCTLKCLHWNALHSRIAFQLLNRIFVTFPIEGRIYWHNCWTC